MDNLLEIIRSKLYFSSSIGASDEQVLASEKSLGLVFSSEFREYLLAFGFASYDGHELTGISKSSRLNVVDVTIEERKKYPNISSDFYVIEQLHIDDVSIWQTSTGEIYQAMPSSDPIKIHNSLIEYIESYNQ